MTSFSLRALLVTGAALSAIAAPLRAEVLPSGGSVQQGVATISQAGPASLLVAQTSSRAIIDWASFSIGKGGSVFFDNGRGATLNRVLGGDPSTIAGQLRATGSLWLMNPAGVLVGPSGQVVTGGHFVASTRGLDAAAFMGGDSMALAGAGAGITNQGHIESGSDTILIGAFVDNRGHIAAGGQATLVAAERVLLRSSAADSRIHVEAAGGAGDVSTAGRIEAASVELRAVGGNVYALAADTGGIVRATGTATVGGRVLLVGGGDVRVSGTVDASGPSGGSIDATAGGRVILTGSARVAARGREGDGGSIRLGGARQGGLPGEARPLASAAGLFVDEGALIDAGSSSGRGGEVILWSEQRTRFDGLIRADGPLGGGFVETSSREALGIDRGRVEVGNGQWLLDPRDVIIQLGGVTINPPYDPDYVLTPPPGSTAYLVNANGLIGALNAGSNVTVTTVSPGSTMAGDITVSRAVDWSGSGSLRLEATRDILVDQTLRTRGAGSLTLDAGRNITVSANITGNGAGNILVDAGGAISVNSAVSHGGAGSLSLLAGGNVQITQTITSTLSGLLLIDAGNEVRIDNNVQTSGSAALTIIGRGAGISVGGNQNRRITTAGGALTLSAPGPAGDILLGKVRGSTTNQVQIFAQSGAVAVTAGRDVILESRGNGGWVRLGQAGDTGGVTVTAGRSLKLLGLPTGTINSFAQIVSAGPVNLSAGAEVVLVSYTGSAAFIQALGPSLTIDTPSGQYNGRVESRGDTLLTGTDHAFSVAPLFDLVANRSFTLDSGAEIDSSVPLAIRTSGGGDVRFLGPVNASVSLLAIAGDELTIGGSILVNGPGDAAVLVAGAKLVNTAGNSLTTPNGRWLTYSVSPLTDEGEEGLTPDAPNLYGRTFAANPPTSILPAGDSRRLYSFRPTLTLTADSGTKLYGQVPVPDLAFTVAGLVPGDLLADALTGPPQVVSNGIPPTSPVGSYPVALIAAASDQGYILQTVPGTLVVNPAPLTITADARSKIYGDADPALTFTGTGFVNGESASVLTGTLARDPGENVGAYAISQGTLAGSNYAISFVGATFTIDPATLTVRALPVTRLYGDPDPAPLPFDATGFKRGDTAASALTGQLARAPGENVGTYAIGQGTLAAQNYVFAFTSADFTITPAPLAVDADDASKLYGAADPAFTFVATGFRLGDTAASLTGALARDPGENVGVYDIRIGTLANPNYAIIFTGGNFEIDPAPLAVVANPQTREYGLADPVFTFTATGFQFGEDASVLSGALSRVPGENVGLYAILEGNLGATNYDIQFTGANLSITPAPLQIIPANVSVKVADLPPDPPLAFSTIGFRRGDTAATALIGALTREDAGGTTPGVYQILPGTLAAVNGNYALSFAAATFTIVEQVLRIVAADKFKTYGQADPTLTFTATGFLPGDDESIITGSLMRAMGENVGLYAILQGTLDAPGYTINFTPAFFVINPATLTVVAQDATREYGLADSIPFAFTATGFQFGEDASVLTGRLGRAPGENVGTHAILEGNLAARNYVFDFTPGTLTIVPAPLDVRAANAGKVYGSPDPLPFAYTASGFRLGDDADILTGTLARAAGENVGQYAIQQGTLSAGSNYVIGFTPGLFTISKAALAVQALDATREYGLADPALAFAATGFVAGDTAATALTGALARDSGENVGVYAVRQGSLAAQNYDISFTPGSFRITPAALAVAAAAVSREYGLADPAPLPFTATGFRLGDTAATVLSGSLVRDPGENVGAYTIRQGSLVANGNYTLGFATNLLTIIPAPLAVAADALGKTYGAADPALTFTASGFRRGDTAASVLTGALVRAPGETVAGSPYAIGRGSLAANSNYSLAFTGADFTISPAALAVVAIPAGKQYGDADPIFSFTATGFQFADTAGTVLTGLLSRDPGETVPGSPFAIRQGTLAANANYSIVFTSAPFTITPAPLTLTADDQTVVYGAPLPPLTVRAGPGQLKFGDTVQSILTGAPAVDGPLVVGTQPISVGTLALVSPNYSFNPTADFIEGTLSIVKALLQVVADAQSKSYGAADPVLTFTATGFVGSEGPGVLTGALARAPGETVAGGPYAIGQGTLDAANYAIQFTGADFTITPAALAVAALPAAKTYGAADPLFAFTATGFQFGEDASVLTGALARTAGENVGLYDITPGTLAGANYVLNLTSAALRIDPALLTVIADAQTREYGLSDPALTFSATGFQFGEGPAVLTGGLARAPGENVGLYAIGQGNLAGANYAIQFAGADLSITPAPLLVTPANSAKVYGNPDPLPFLFTATGFRRGDTAAGALTGALSRAPGEVLGDYAILPGTLAAVAGNYALTFEAATFSITARLLQIIAQEARKTYGDADPVLTFVATGYAPGEGPGVFTGSLARAPGEDAGQYVISQGTLAAPNYTFAFQPGLFTIDPALLLVQALDASREYGLPDPAAFAFTASGFRRGDDASVLTGQLVRAAGEDVGAYSIGQGSLAAANYVFDFRPGSYRITPAPLAIAAADAGKVYGAADPAPFPFTAAGFRLGDTAAILTGALARAAGENVGSYAIGQGSLSAGANYAIGFTPANFRISPAALAIVADSLSREYGLADPALTFTATGLVAGDTVASALTGGLARAAGEDVGFYAIGQGDLAAANYAISFTGGTLAITPAPLAVAANAARKTYGDADPALTFAATGFRRGDTAAEVLTGGLLRAPGETVAGNPYAIGQGTLVANANYQLRFAGADFLIDRRPLGVSLVGQVIRQYDATTGVQLTAGNFALSNLVAGDQVGATAAAARFDTPDVGSAKLVTASGIGLTGADANNYSVDALAAAAIGSITPAPLSVRALDAARPFGRPNPPFGLIALGLLGSDTLAGIGLAGVTPATTLSPPDLYPIEVAGSPRNYVVTRQSAVLTVTPPLGADLPPQQVSVPALGGLVQQGVVAGASALTDTLRFAPGGAQRLIATTRFTISIAPSPAAVQPGLLGGSDAFAAPPVAGGRLDQ